jgi:hypothetical protein
MIGNEYISNNHLDFEDIIKKYLKYNILHIPKENEFIILQINPKNLNDSLINYSIHSPLKINIYGFTYIINDISYYCGGNHYVNHSYRENKWLFYNDIGNTDDKKGTEVNFPWKLQLSDLTSETDKKEAEMLIKKYEDNSKDKIR